MTSACQRSGQSVLFPWDPVIVPANSEVERQVTGYLPVVLEECTDLVLVDIANLQGVVREVVPCSAQVINEAGLGQGGQRSGQPREHVLGNLLVPSARGTRQSWPCDTRYRGQEGVTDAGCCTVGATLHAAAERGLCAGPPVFRAKLERMCASIPADRIRIDPPWTDFLAGVGKTLEAGPEGHALEPDIRQNRLTVYDRKERQYLIPDIVSIYRSTGVCTCSRESEPCFVYQRRGERRGEIDGHNLRTPNILARIPARPRR